MRTNFENKQIILEKPPVLYHGSPHKDIEVFEPRPTTFNHTQKGEYIVGTPDFVNALPYIFSGFINGVRTPWVAANFATSKENFVYLMIPCTKEAFIAHDKGGAVYSFSPESFTSVPERKNYEWYSEEKVKPDEKREFGSILETWEAYDIHPFFSHTRTIRLCTITSGKRTGRVPS